MKASLSNRAGRGMIAVVANLEAHQCKARVALDLDRLDQSETLTGHDILTRETISFAAGTLTLTLEPMQFSAVRLEPVWPGGVRIGGHSVAGHYAP